MHDCLMFDVLLLGKSVAHIFVQSSQLCFSIQDCLHNFRKRRLSVAVTPDRHHLWIVEEKRLSSTALISIPSRKLFGGKCYLSQVSVHYSSIWENNTANVWGNLVWLMLTISLGCGTKKSGTGGPHSFCYLCFAGDEALTLLETAYFRCPCNAIPKWWSLRFIQLDFCSQFPVTVITGKSSK